MKTIKIQNMDVTFDPKSGKIEVVNQRNGNKYNGYSVRGWNMISKALRGKNWRTKKDLFGL